MPDQSLPQTGFGIRHDVTRAFLNRNELVRIQKRLCHVIPAEAGIQRLLKSPELGPEPEIRVSGRKRASRINKNMMLNKAGKIFDKINYWFSWVGGLLIVIAMIIIFVDVVMRYIWNKPSISVYYYSEYILLYSTFMAASYVLKIDRHIRVDIIYHFISNKAKIILYLISNLFGFIYTLFLFYLSSEMVYTAFLRGTKFSTPMEHYQFPVLAIIPFGCFLLSIQWIRRIKDDFQMLIHKGWEN
jgi:C4-dicarboxylate transporter, DctQ subunit